MNKASKNFSYKKQPPKASLNKARMQTQILQEELDAGMLVLERIKKQRDYMLAQVKLELQSQKDLRAKIEYLKKEYKLLSMSHAANKNILNNVRNERQSLESDVFVLEKAMRKLKGTEKNLLVQNDFSRLIEVVNLTGNSNEKEKSVLLTCVRDLIHTTEENEFEGFTWRAKYAQNNRALAVRIRFDQLNIRQNDLKNIYQSVIAGLAQKFKKYHLRVQTKTKNQNGVITSMELTFQTALNSKAKKVENELY